MATDRVLFRGVSGVQQTGVFEHPAGTGFLKHRIVFNNPVQLSLPFNKSVKGLLSGVPVLAQHRQKDTAAGRIGHMPNARKWLLPACLVEAGEIDPDGGVEERKTRNGPVTGANARYGV